MRAIVERWMEREPLQVMARHARPGLRAFLLTARRAGARVGVLSDYPAEAKLRALGVRELVDVVRSTHDDELGRLKPDPSGLQLVAADLGVAPAETVYVGDRPAVDAVAAARAGMRAYIIGANYGDAHVAFVPVASFAALSAELFP
jgi:HAD superfamily hydrolase (TIGR01549 family)